MSVPAATLNPPQQPQTSLSTVAGNPSLPSQPTLTKIAVTKTTTPKLTLTTTQATLCHSRLMLHQLVAIEESRLSSVTFAPDVLKQLHKEYESALTELNANLSKLFLEAKAITRGIKRTEVAALEKEAKELKAFAIDRWSSLKLDTVISLNLFLVKNGLYEKARVLIHSSQKVTAWSTSVKTEEFLAGQRFFKNITSSQRPQLTSAQTQCCIKALQGYLAGLESEQKKKAPAFDFIVLRKPGDPSLNLLAAASARFNYTQFLLKEDASITQCDQFQHPFKEIEKQYADLKKIIQESIIPKGVSTQVAEDAFFYLLENDFFKRKNYLSLELEKAAAALNSAYEQTKHRIAVPVQNEVDAKSMAAAKPMSISTTEPLLTLAEGIAAIKAGIALLI